MWGGVLQHAATSVVRSAQLARARVRAFSANRAVNSFRAGRGRPHSLPGPLIVTLTSYPPRFSTLSKTLKSLLMQSVQPDAVTLWIADRDVDCLPKDVLELKRAGLEICLCDDLMSYKKIIPALEHFPEAFLVTADDDLYYDRHWLKKIASGHSGRHQSIVCRRAHRPRYDGDALLPYAKWEHDIVTNGAIEPCIFPTTGAGALFPPGSLVDEVTDRSVFGQLCPHADDVWLFATALKAGTSFRQVGGGFAQITWENSQHTSLMQRNLGTDGNDRQLSAVIKYFGLQKTLYDHCQRPRGSP